MSHSILQPAPLTDRTNISTIFSTKEIMQHVRELYPSPPSHTNVTKRRPETLRRNITPLKDQSNNKKYQNNSKSLLRRKRNKTKVAKRSRIQQLSQPRASGTRKKFIAWSPERAASLSNPTRQGRKIVPQRNSRLQRLAAPREKRVKFNERKFQILEVIDDNKLLTKALDVQRKDAAVASRLTAAVSRDVYNRQRRPLTARAIHEHENPQSPQTSPSKKPRPSSAPSTPKPYRDSKITSNNRALNMEKHVTRLCRFREDIITNIKLSIRNGTYVEKIDHYVDQLREATLKVTEGVTGWRKLLFQKVVHRQERASPFMYSGENYLLSIPSSMNFIGNNQEVVYTMGGKESYSTFARNPLLLRDCEYLDSFNSVARSWETRMRYFACEKLILAEERTTYGGTHHLGHFVSFSSCLVQKKDSNNPNNQDNPNNPNNQENGSNSEIVSDDDFSSIGSPTSSSIQTISPRYSPSKQIEHYHSNIEEMSLEEQASEIHSRLHMSIPIRHRRERKDIQRRTNNDFNNRSTITTPRIISRRPNSAPYNSPHQKLLQYANEKSMLSSSLANGVGPRHIVANRIERPHTSTGTRNSTLSLARFHTSLSEAMEHIGRIGDRKILCIENNNITTERNQIKQRNQNGHGNQTEKHSGTWDETSRNKSSAATAITTSASLLSSSWDEWPRSNSSISPMMSQSNKRSIIHSISTPISSHRNVASSISRSRIKAACTIQSQFRRFRKRTMMQNALTQMNRIVSDHMEEAAAGCLQRVWRGSFCRLSLIRSWAPTLITSPKAYDVTLRRERNKTRNMFNQLHGKEQNENKNMKKTKHINRYTTYKYGNKTSSKENNSATASTASTASATSTAPWRAQPRFALWRIQWWLSRYIARWRFRRLRKAVAKVQARFRQYSFERKKFELKCIVKIQTQWRSSKAREERKVRQMRAFHMAALFIQTAWWRNLQSKKRRKEMKAIIQKSLVSIERKRYEQAMKDDNYLSLINRDLILDNIRDHVGIGGGCHISEVHITNFKKRFFRKFKDRIQRKKAMFLDPNVNNPKHVYKLQESLLLASRRGDISTVNALLDEGVNPSCSNDRGDSCLHMGCAGGSVDIVQALLDAQANIAASDVLGRTCLHVVCETGNYDILQTILTSKSSSKRLDVNALASGNITPLHLCAMLGNDQLAKELLIHGANLNIKDAQGYTPIHHASIKGHQEMINLLGEFDEDMILLSIRDASGSTALHHAVENGHIDIVKSLLSFTWNPNIINDAGQNCLDLATSTLEPKNGYRYMNHQTGDTRDENGVLEEMTVLLKSYGAIQHVVSDGRSISFNEHELKSPNPNREKKMIAKRQRVGRTLVPPRKSDVIVSNYSKVVDKTVPAEQKLEMIAEDQTQLHVPKVHFTEVEVREKEVIYLDSESQCYYKYSLVTGESEWLSYEENQNIGIQSY